MNKARSSAMAMGRKRYAPGVPCSRGHYAERYTSSGFCVVCTDGNDDGFIGSERRMLGAIDSRLAFLEEERAALNSLAALLIQTHAVSTGVRVVEGEA